MAKPNPKDCMLMERKGETITREPGSLQGYDFLIDGCEGCEIRLLDRMAQVQVDYCKDCKILLGPVSGPVFARNCERCVILVACQQLRTRECSNCDVLLQIPGHPIIETSRDIRFGPLPLTLYPEMVAQMQEGKLSIEKNEWGKIYDFSPENPAACTHYTLLTESEAAGVLDAFPARPKELDTGKAQVAEPQAEGDNQAAIVTEQSDEASEIRVTVKQKASFYSGLCLALLEGRPEKDGRPELTGKSVVTLSGAGAAVAIAVQTAARLQSDGKINIKGVHTSLVNSGRYQAPKISISVCSSL